MILSLLGLVYVRIVEHFGGLGPKDLSFGPKFTLFFFV